MLIRKYPVKNITALFIAAIIIFAAVFVFSPAKAQAAEKDTFSEHYAEAVRPSSAGRLRVQDSVLVDEKGVPVQLRGVSTHGLTWFPEFISDDFISAVSEDWNCGLIRLAMYSENYCGDEKDLSLDLMTEGIEAAISADMYVIVDWHILNDSDPNINREEAKAFFSQISKKYSGYPNLIYEICNEPNGDTDWDDITAYSREIIPVIRENDSEAVVIVGTPDYDRDLDRDL